MNSELICDPKAANTHILICSHDPRLLETRQLVLERVGFKVTAIADPEAFEQIVEQHPVDVCVLCQTLSSQECQRIVDKVRGLQQEIKYVVLAAPGSQCEDHAADEDAVLNTFIFPELLVAEVQRLAGIKSCS